MNYNVSAPTPQRSRIFGSFVKSLAEFLKCQSIRRRKEDEEEEDLWREQWEQQSRFCLKFTKYHNMTQQNFGFLTDSFSFDFYQIWTWTSVRVCISGAVLLEVLLSLFIAEG